MELSNIDGTIRLQLKGPYLIFRTPWSSNGHIFRLKIYVCDLWYFKQIILACFSNPMEYLGITKLAKRINIGATKIIAEIVESRFPESHI